MALYRANLQAVQHCFHLNAIMTTFTMWSGVLVIQQYLHVSMESANYNYGILIKTLRLLLCSLSSLSLIMLGSRGN